MDHTETSPPTAPDNRWFLLGLLGVFAFGVVFGLWLSRDRPLAESSVEVGFVRDMIDHHEQATVMASIAIEWGVDAETATFAREVLVSQRWETGLMDGWLREWDLDRGDPERGDAMAWMGEPTTLVEMPGMQTEAALDDLGGQPNAEARAVRFLTMMIDHHRGGVAMADHAAEHADDDAVRDFADMVAANQQGEIAEYLTLLKRLNPEAAASAATPRTEAAHTGHGG